MTTSIPPKMGQHIYSYRKRKAVTCILCASAISLFFIFIMTGSLKKSVPTSMQVLPLTVDIMDGLNDQVHGAEQSVVNDMNNIPKHTSKSPYFQESNTESREKTRARSEYKHTDSGAIHASTYITTAKVPGNGANSEYLHWKLNKLTKDISFTKDQKPSQGFNLFTVNTRLRENGGSIDIAGTNRPITLGQQDSLHAMRTSSSSHLVQYNPTHGSDNVISRNILSLGSSLQQIKATMTSIDSGVNDKGKQVESEWVVSNKLINSVQHNLAQNEKTAVTSPFTTTPSQANQKEDVNSLLKKDEKYKYILSYKSSRTGSNSIPLGQQQLLLTKTMDANQIPQIALQQGIANTPFKQGNSPDLEGYRQRLFHANYIQRSKIYSSIYPDDRNIRKISESAKSVNTQKFELPQATPIIAQEQINQGTSIPGLKKMPNAQSERGIGYQQQPVQTQQNKTDQILYFKQEKQSILQQSHPNQYQGYHQDYQKLSGQLMQQKEQHAYQYQQNQMNPNLQPNQMFPQIHRYQHQQNQNKQQDNAHYQFTFGHGNADKKHQEQLQVQQANLRKQAIYHQRKWPKNNQLQERNVENQELSLQNLQQNQAHTQSYLHQYKHQGQQEYQFHQVQRYQDVQQNQNIQYQKQQNPAKSKQYQNQQITHEQPDQKSQQEAQYQKKQAQVPTYQQENQQQFQQANQKSMQGAAKVFSPLQIFVNKGQNRESDQAGSPMKTAPLIRNHKGIQRKDYGYSHYGSSRKRNPIQNPDTRFNNNEKWQNQRYVHSQRNLQKSLSFNENKQTNNQISQENMQHNFQHDFLSNLLSLKTKFNQSSAVRPTYSAHLKELVTPSFNLPHHDKEDPGTARSDECSGCFKRPYHFVINSPEVCQNLLTNDKGEPTLDLLIFITSVNRNRNKRNMIRRTWTSVAKRNQHSRVRYAFLLGHKTDEADTQLSMERHIHKDILMQSFIDTYHNLTLKTLMAFEWTQTYCPGAKYIMKTDDDVYVNVNNILNRLIGRSLYDNSIFGWCELSAAPIRDPLSKWYVSKHQYPHDNYPGFCSGTGYLMPSDVARRILHASLNTPFFYLEDVYVSLCAHKVGVRLKRVIGFSNDKIPIYSRFCDIYGKKSFYTSHGLSPYEMDDVWTRCR